MIYYSIMNPSQNVLFYTNNSQIIHRDLKKKITKRKKK